MFLSKTAAYGACLISQCGLVAVGLVFLATHRPSRFRPFAVIRSTGHSLPMRVHRWLIGAGLAFATGPTIAGPSGCGLPEITGSRALHQALSLRAVELVRR